MTNTPLSQHDKAIRRIFLVQLSIVLIAVVMVFLGLALENFLGEDRSFGFFWFAFLAGCMGSSIAMVQKIAKTPDLAETLHASWITTLAPVLFGGLMASVTYFLFMSDILSGDAGGGLLRTNLFPSFKAAATEGQAPSITAFVAMRPQSVEDVGKLLVWCFLAGYSENFVLGVLNQLKRTTPGE